MVIKNQSQSKVNYSIQTTIYFSENKLEYIIYYADYMLNKKT